MRTTPQTPCDAKNVNVPFRISSLANTREADTLLACNLRRGRIDSALASYLSISYGPYEINGPILIGWEQWTTVFKTGGGKVAVYRNVRHERFAFIFLTDTRSKTPLLSPLVMAMVGAISGTKCGAVLRLAVVAVLLLLAVPTGYCVIITVVSGMDTVAAAIVAGLSFMVKSKYNSSERNHV